jgi:CDP-diacylglycerol--glycerol-3-phosphate 3-phosphatidyltransferase
MAECDAWTGAALPIAAVALLGFAALRGEPKEFARVRREQGSAFLGERIMHRGYTWVDWLARRAHAAGFTPDAVSWLSLGLGALAGCAAGNGWLGAAAWLLALSGLCDGVDGALARQRHGGSAAGAVLDSALDRYVEFFFFAGLVVYFRGAWPYQLLTVVALFGGFMVTYSTAKAEALQLAPPRGWMKRPERIVWLIGGAAIAAAARLFAVNPDPVLVSVLAVIAVFANASAVVRLRALARAARER